MVCHRTRLQHITSGLVPSCLQSLFLGYLTKVGAKGVVTPHLHSVLVSITPHQHFSIVSTHGKSLPPPPHAIEKPVEEASYIIPFLQVTELIKYQQTQINSVNHTSLQTLCNFFLADAQTGAVPADRTPSSTRHCTATSLFHCASLHKSALL